MTNKGRLFNLLLFIVISIVVLLFGEYYKTTQSQQFKAKVYANLANTMTAEVKTLIDEKKNATLAIAMAFAQGVRLNDHPNIQGVLRSQLEQYSQQLREKTDFKNVWIQLVDSSGISKARSWTDKHGDDLSMIRHDVRDMLRHPQVKSTISVGRFDMTFKSMVPIYKSDQFTGFIEVITHFNSIAKQVEIRDYRVLIVLDARYKQQLTHPFTRKFAGDHYIANQSADPMLLEYIQNKGLAPLINNHVNHVVDSQLGELVINHPLFDSDGRPMANFLMFKPLQQLDMENDREIRTRVNLLMLLTLVVVAIILYLTSLKQRKTREEHRHTWRVVFILCFLILAFSYIGLLHFYRQSKLTDFFQVYNQQLFSKYLIVENKFSGLADLIYHNTINNADVLSLVALAYTGDEQKQRARTILFDTLSPQYAHLKKHNLRQLHFHLRDNESFLRFHRPEKFGDNLTNIRATVAWVNLNQSQIQGFEEGRIYNGFRYVFPLFTASDNSKRQHIGSVEASFSAYALLSELIVDQNARGGFLIRSDVVKNKVFEQEKLNYSPSIFPEFSFENSIRKQLEHNFKHMDSSQLSEKQIQTAGQHILDGEPFTLGAKNHSSLFSFIPLKNPVSGNVVATLIVQKQHTFLRDLHNSFQIQLVTGVLSILLLVVIGYREFSSKTRIQRLLVKTQRILDAQKSMVIITNGRKLLDCNRKLLDFFGYESLEVFFKHHNCICDRFIKNDRFFHLGKLAQGITWVMEIDRHPDQEYIVAIADAKGHEHAFALSLSRFDEHYIVSFQDMTGTISEHFSLAEKVMHDSLTKAFNRAYFHNHVHHFIEQSHQQACHLGLVIFDIDYFKKINDQFGHPLGDRVLIKLVENVKSNIRSEDALIRWGGEEFLLLVQTDSPHNLERMVEHIRIRLMEMRHDKVGQVTCSFGLTLHHESETIEQTIERADQALYQAKHDGRNRSVRIDLDR